MKSNQLLLPLLTSFGLFYGQAVGRALPPPEDMPEERLRTEIILEARSPLNGEPLSPAEYEELQAQLVDYPAPVLDSQIREIVFLLQLRRVLRPIVPFLP
ncbi:MAG: glutathione S-transferase [Leptolyngbya sp. SIOISBB]|nr:glutathione S-transferase [Leptolyngbya sp. SIOISBB]